MEKDKVYPKEENLGKDCKFWDLGCSFPKAEVWGRMSCEGVVDPVCIYLRTGKKVEEFDLTEEQVTKLKTTPPSISMNHSIPADRPLDIS